MSSNQVSYSTIFVFHLRKLQQYPLGYMYPWVGISDTKVWFHGSSQLCQIVYLQVSIFHVGMIILNSGKLFVIHINYQAAGRLIIILYIHAKTQHTLIHTAGRTLAIPHTCHSPLRSW